MGYKGDIQNERKV